VLLAGSKQQEATLLLSDLRFNDRDLNAGHER